MKPEQESKHLLSVTRSKAKMFEYSVPKEHHIEIKQDPAKLFTIAIGLLGDLAASINREKTDSSNLLALRGHLLFSTHFFDAYLQSKLNESLNPYLVLLGSASYYLCDLPGSASVLVKLTDKKCPNLGSLEKMLFWLLQAEIKPPLKKSNGFCNALIDDISQHLPQFFRNGTGEKGLLKLATKLRNTAYESGTPRELLFADVIAAVLRRKLENSTWKVLPLYSEQHHDKWQRILQKESFIKELWPAQHLLGKAGVLKGKSAVIQMPTSAGKTKAVELIIRRAFIADHTSLAIIIAPFRALCHEITSNLVQAFQGEAIKIDELSDTPQTDFRTAEPLEDKQIIVVTPEKLSYALRHDPKLVDKIGVLIFDEGHQFDSGTRGITYELLLTSLLSMISRNTQKILISAVISNAESVSEWLNSESNVVEDTTLVPVLRSVGFASWPQNYKLGQIQYVNTDDNGCYKFFVPRVIEMYNLGKNKQEKKDRFFPDSMTNTQDIALYLGLKLVPKGSIAIFCGTKMTANKICKRAADIINRKVPLTLPSEYSDAEEVERLKYLHVKNIGPEAPASKAAEHGIFSHHGNTPHGIRLAVEYAMREDLVRFVICTSTLAQGVNLPIRYLIVTSTYQGKNLIKSRDFQNLIGRAGRAGMHTEGSILFADPEIYDSTNKRNLERAKELLEPSNLEPCISNLLSIFEPTKSNNNKFTINIEGLAFAEAYINNTIDGLISEELRGGEELLEDFSDQVSWKKNLICAVESFLLFHLDGSETNSLETDAIRLVEGTLAFFLADSQKKEQIKNLFALIAKNISTNITDPKQRKLYGKTLYGIQDSQKIEKWVQDNKDALLILQNDDELLELIWPMFTAYIDNRNFQKFNNKCILKDIAKKWVLGAPFHELLQISTKSNCKIGKEKNGRTVTIEHIINICENGISYNGALFTNSICEFLRELNREGVEQAIKFLQLFQKRLRYGLPTVSTVILYELGFSDRVISQDLSLSLNIQQSEKSELLKFLNQHSQDATNLMKKYPKYFQERLKSAILFNLN